LITALIYAGNINSQNYRLKNSFAKPIVLLARQPGCYTNLWLAHEHPMLALLTIRWGGALLLRWRLAGWAMRSVHQLICSWW